MTPESCADCKYFWYDSLPYTAVSLYSCELARMALPDDDRERPVWCPLEERDGDAPQDR